MRLLRRTERRIALLGALTGLLCACDGLLPPIPGDTSTDTQSSDSANTDTDATTGDPTAGDATTGDPTAGDDATTGDPTAGDTSEGESTDDDAPKDLGDVFTIISSTQDRVTTSKLTPEQRAEIRRGNVDLSFDMLDKLPENSENLAVSALSLRGAFGMVHAMAKGQTQTEIAQALGLGDDPELVRDALNDIDQSLMSRNLPAEGDADPVILSTANRVFLPNNILPAPNFVDTLGQYYGASSYHGNFQKDSGPILSAVNGWVSKQTRGLIPKLLTTEDVNPKTEWLLVNALYFKAPWATKDRIETDISFTPDNSLLPKKVEGVALQDFHAPFGKEDGFEWALLPLRGGDLSLMMILPEQGKLAQVRRELSGERVEKMLADQKTGLVWASFPKFKVNGQRVGLIPYLQGRGMNLPFDGGDFSGATLEGTPLSPIATVLQSCVVAVDEKGVEAAAATAVAGEDEVKDYDMELKVDRPFLFAVFDEPTGLMLFAGQVLDPTQ